jgi:MFS family permease
VLREPPFRTLWIGDLAARSGHQVTAFTLPLLVVTLLAGTGTQTGLIGAAQFVPVLAFSLPVGAWTARANLRWILVSGNAARGAVLFGIGALAAMEGLTFWLLLAGAFLIGSAAVLHDIGLQVAVPRLVDGDRLVSGNGLLQATTSVTQMGGPAVAGFVVQGLGASWAATVTGALFCGAALAMATLPGAALGPAAHAGAAPTIRAGLRFVRRCRPIRDLCVQSALFNLHEQAFATVFLIYAVRTLGLSGGVVGLVIGLGSLGALAGSLLAGRIGSRLHYGRAVTTSILIAACGLLAVPGLATVGTVAVLLGAGFVVNGAALAVYNVLAVTIRQHVPPPQLLGAVTASYRIAAFGSLPVGALLGGVLADLAGPTAAMWTVAVSLTVASLLLYASPIRRAATLHDVRTIADRSLGKENADGRDG